MWNAWLDEAQAGIKIAGRNTNNLRYEEDITLWQKSEELKSLLIKVKEESEKVFIFWKTPSLQMVTAAMKLKDTCCLEEKLWQT